MLMVMHNGQVKKEAKIAQRRQFPDFKVLAPSPRDNQGCSGGVQRIYGVERDSSLFTIFVQLLYKVPLHCICAFLYKISNYSLSWCNFCRFPFASHAILAFVFVDIRDFPLFSVLVTPFGVWGAISMTR